MSRGNTYETYFVPLYKSITIKTPENLFFYMSQSENMRKKWFKCAHIMLVNQENGIIFVVKIISI